VAPGDHAFGRIAVDFLDHHVHPGRTAEVGFFVSAHRPALVVTTPLLLVACLVRAAPTLAAAVYWVGVVAMFVPQAHKEAHRRSRSAWVRALQATRVLLHPSAHAAHHADNAVAYCVFTGWWNPLLDRAAFWRGLEAMSRRFRGQTRGEPA
jgi:hypothetical protein